MTVRRHALTLLLCGIGLAGQASEVAFSRIIHGWTNYSTGFTTTHETAANGEFATAATFYAPPFDVKAVDFGTIVIWSERPPDVVDFSDFAFLLCFWTSLDAFVRNPVQGDFANVNFTRPTRIAMDTVTVGGRPAYELRFALTNGLRLSRCQTYLIGLVARTEPARNGELYVPTAPTEGPSDVQAGNIVPFGWQYLIDAGGLTVYSGQLATELLVDPLGTPPALRLAQRNSSVLLSWPAWASCYGLEAAESLEGPWSTITNRPTVSGEWHELILSRTHLQTFYRLQAPPRRPEPDETD